MGFLAEWSEVQQNPHFWEYSPDERAVIKSNWFRKNVAPTEKFQSYSEDEQAKILDAFTEYGNDIAPGRTAGDVVGDLGISLGKGIVGAGEAVVGLADIPTGGLAGKAMEEGLGYDPKFTKEVFERGYSAGQKAANEAVERAQGFVGTTKEMVTHPSTLIHGAVESAPSMIGGGGIAKLGLKAVPGLAATTGGLIVASAAGEGLFSAGSSAEQMRQESPTGLLTPKQSGIAALSGLGTAAFALAGGRLANKLGFADPDTMLLGVKAPVKNQAGVVRRIIEGGISEGAFEELPQSLQEQIWQNAATGRPIMENVPKAGVQGGLIGTVMGGGANIVSMPRATPQEAALQKIGTATTIDEAVDAFNVATQPKAGLFEPHTEEAGKAFEADILRQRSGISDRVRPVTLARQAEIDRQGAEEARAGLIQGELDRQAALSREGLIKSEQVPTQAKILADQGFRPGPGVFGRQILNQAEIDTIAEQEKRDAQEGTRQVGPAGEQKGIQGEAQAGIRLRHDEQAGPAQRGDEQGEKVVTILRKDKYQEREPFRAFGQNEPGLVEYKDILSLTGKPFKAKAGAVVSLRSRKNLPAGYAPVQVDGGWVLRKSGAQAEPVAAPKLKLTPLSQGPPEQRSVSLEVGPLKPTKKGKGPQNLVGYLTPRADFPGISLGPDYDYTEMGQYPDLHRVLRKKGKPIDEVADELKAAGYPIESGDHLLETLKSGKGREIFTIERQDEMLDKFVKKNEMPLDEVIAHAIELDPKLADELRSTNNDTRRIVDEITAIEADAGAAAAVQREIESESKSEIAAEEGITQEDLERELADWDALSVKEQLSLFEKKPAKPTVSRETPAQQELTKAAEILEKPGKPMTARPTFGQRGKFGGDLGRQEEMFPPEKPKDLLEVERKARAEKAEAPVNVFSVESELTNRVGDVEQHSFQIYDNKKIIGEGTFAVGKDGIAKIGKVSTFKGAGSIGLSGIRAIQRQLIERNPKVKSFVGDRTGKHLKEPIPPAPPAEAPEAKKAEEASKPTGTEPGSRATAQRIVNAETEFVSNIVEQFDFTKEEATSILDEYRKRKLVKLDPVMGRYDLKDGRFWDKDVMRRAIEEAPKPTEQPAEKIKRTTYDQAVLANIKHMGAPASEWRAVPVLGTEATKDASGRDISMPAFDFPKGYKKAPTLYPAGGGAMGDNNCEWCGTPIKKAYWIQNDTKKWTLQVGSECITHFEEGKSGERLAKEQIWGQNRDFIRKAVAAKRALFDAFKRTEHLGYGRKRVVVGVDYGEVERGARDTHEQLKKLTDKVTADSSEYWGVDASSDASVTRWVKRHRDEVSTLIDRAADLVQRKTGTRPTFEEAPKPTSKPEVREAEPKSVMEPGQKYERGVKIDLSSLSEEVLSKMDRILKGKGYDVRGVDDVRRLMYEGRVVRDGILWQPDWIDAYNRATGAKAEPTAKKYKKSDFKNIDWKNLKRLGTTVDIKEAGYFAPDGSMIDLSGKRIGGPVGDRALDHRVVGGTGAMQELMALGYIRVNVAAGIIDLAASPTPKQVQRIRSLSAIHNGAITIDLKGGLGEYDARNEYYKRPGRFFSQEYPKGTPSDRIINDIKRFFSGEDPIPLRIKESNQKFDSGLDRVGKSDLQYAYESPVAKAQLSFDFTPVKRETPSLLPASQRVRVHTTGNIKYSGNVVSGPADVASLLAHLRKDPQEQFYFVTTDKDGVILEIHRYGRGGRASATVYASEVAGRILNTKDAKKAYIVHNHPSAEPRPSIEDHTIFSEIANMLKSKDIEAEGVVIGGRDFLVLESKGEEKKQKIPPANRKVSLPVVERRLNRNNKLFYSRTNITNSTILRNFLKDHELQEVPGVLLVDPQSMPVTFMPIIKGRAMKDTTADLLKLAEASGSGALMVNNPLGSDAINEYTRALYSGLGDLGLIEVLDKGVSWADTGKIPAPKWGQTNKYNILLSENTFEASKARLLVALTSQRGTLSWKAIDGTPIHEDMMTVSRYLIEQGYSKWIAFRAEAHRIFADVLDKIRHLIHKAFNRVKQTMKDETGAVSIIGQRRPVEAQPTPQPAPKPTPSAQPSDIIKEKFDVPEKKSVARVVKNVFTTKSITRERAKQFAADVRTDVIDRYHPIKALGETPYILHRMLGNTHAVLATFLQHGKLAWKDNALIVEEKGKGLFSWLKPLKDDGRNLFYWMAAKRAEVLEGEGRENWLDEAARKAIYDIVLGPKGAERTAKEKRFEVLNKEFQAYNKNIIQIAKEAGLLNDEQIDAWTKDYYLPFYRLLEDEVTREEFLRSPFKSKQHISAQIRRLKGGTEKIGDPIENILRNWSHLIQESQRNVARSAAADVAVGMGLASEVPKSELTKVLGSQTVKVYGVQRVGAKRAVRLFDTREEADAYSKEIAEKNKKPYEVVERKNTTVLFGKKEDFSIVSYQKDGETVYVQIEDPRLFNAMSEVNIEAFNSGLLKVLTFSKRLLTAGATFSPAFRVANLLRDTLHTAVVAKSFIPFVDSARGFVKSWADSPENIAVMSSGAGFGAGWVESGDPKAMARAIEKIIKREGQEARGRILDTPRRMLAFWEKVGRASEMAARVQLYSNLRSKGETHLKAAFESRDLLDFYLSGSVGAVRVLSAVTPFLNARVQGLDRLYRGAKQNPRAFFAKGALVAGASLMLWALFKDDDRYKELEDWDKWQYHHFWIGKTHFRLPKAFEVGAIFSSLFETMASVLDGQEDFDFFARFLGHTLTQTFALNMPAAFGPGIETFANKSLFTGRPIESLGMRNLPPGERSKPWTPEILKALGKGTNISPRKMEHIIYGHTSTFGAMALSVADSMYRFAVDVPPAPALRPEQLPAIGRFMRGDTAHTKHATRYYEFKRDLDEAVSTINYYQKMGDYDKARDLIKKSKNSLKYKAFTNMIERQLRALKLKEEKVWASRQISPKQKRSELDKLMQKRNAVYRTAYERIFGA